jgi:hypothetical protein
VLKSFGFLFLPVIHCKQLPAAGTLCNTGNNGLYNKEAGNHFFLFLSDLII